MLVGVTGRAQHGKDTIAMRLVDAWGFTRKGLADPLKELALTLNPVIPWDSASWDTLEVIVKESGWERAKTYPEVRRILQVLGTEGCRGTFGENCWVDALENWWVDSGVQHLVVPDIRFHNEAAWVHRMGGILIGVHRPGYYSGVSLEHPSEKDIPFLDTDVNLSNAGDVFDLWQRVDALAADIMEGFSVGK